MSRYLKVTKEDELTHWGVLGMKWGVRKDKQGSSYRKVEKDLDSGKLKSRDSRQVGPTTKKVANKIMELNGSKAKPRTKDEVELKDAKVAKKKAYKEYSKAYNKASANPLNAWTKKGNAKWDEAINKAEDYARAKVEYNTKKQAFNAKARKKSINAKIEKYSKAVDKDIDSFKPFLKTGITSDNGKVVFTADDVQGIVKGLEDTKAKHIAKMQKRIDL